MGNIPPVQHVLGCGPRGGTRKQVLEDGHLGDTVVATTDLREKRKPAPVMVHSHFIKIGFFIVLFSYVFREFLQQFSA